MCGVAFRHVVMLPYFSCGLVCVMMFGVGMSSGLWCGLLLFSAVVGDGR